MSDYLRNAITSFCSPSDESLRTLIDEKLLALSFKTQLYIRGHIGTLESDDTVAHGGDVRGFLSDCILNLDNNVVPGDYGAYFDDVLTTIQSLSGNSKVFPVLASNEEARRAFLDFSFEMLTLDDLDTPSNARVMLFVPEPGGASYMKYRDDQVIELVCRHPEKWKTISDLIIHHKITHAPAIETLLSGNGAASIASGVL